MRTLWIGTAGFAGAIARYGLEGWVSGRTAGAFPWGTLAVNTSGSFLLGLLFTLFAERFLMNPSLRSALTIGFVGAYTTFSTFSLETVRLIEDGASGLALVNVVGSVVLGIAAVYTGTFVGRAL